MVKKINHKKLRNKNLELGVLLFGLLFVLSLTFFLNQGSITGDVVLELDRVYFDNESVNGKLSLVLNEGELIPADTDVILSLNGVDYNYKLSDLVLSELIEGDYFVQGKSVQGSGQGYGIEGSKITYPDVSFVVGIKTGSGSQGSQGSGESGNEENPEVVEETEEVIEEETEEPVEETEVVEETEEPVEETEEVGEESGSENVVEEENEESNSETTGESSSESSASESSFESAPLTGNVVAGFDNEIQGVTSKNNPFEYNLNPSQNAELISSEHDVDLSVVDGKLVVTTDYSESIEGFGNEYIGEENYNLEIDLSSLGLENEEGELKIYVKYGDEEIASTSTQLSNVIPEVSEEVIDVNETLEDLNESLEEWNETFVNVTESVNLSKYDLSQEELFILTSKTGAKEVLITKSEIVNEKLIIRFEIGNYWIEKSYDPYSELDDLIELDRVKWVKNLAKSLNEKVPASEKVEKYIGNYSL
jgi:hypothetical protein